MRNFLYRVRDGIARFMTGRYGSDKLNLTILITALVLDVLYMFIRFLPLSLLSSGLVIWAFIRMLSRNIPKRYAENRKFLSLISELKMLKSYHIYRCKNCGQKIRIPRKGGKKVEIRCPKCGHTFIKKI